MTSTKVYRGANNKDSRRIGDLHDDNIDCTVANNRRDWMTSRLKSRRANDSARRHPSEPETALERPASPFTSPISFIKDRLVRDSESWIFGAW